MTQNLLADETSPYLLQHRDNPVHWHPWNDDALARARAENKPILLSIGYSACHWCHVMAHESFEDPDIATLMNALFVNIKVDREERPDLDVIYQSSLALMGEAGGWPLTMFLTPEAKPYWGGTYFPATPRYGRPAFPDLIKSLAGAYHEQPERVGENVEALHTALEQLSKPAGGGGLTVSLCDEAARLSLDLTDPLWGGTKGAPKFPQASFFRFLWRSFRRTGSAAYGDIVTLTLDRMCQGGIYDHLGGGFARYATDDHWLAPHFEKMLYDNAQIIDLLCEAWLATGAPLYATRMAETIDWVLRDMTVGVTADGGFALASACDADSEGVEGKFYVWDEAEIDTLLGAGSAAFKAAYDVRAAGNWEGHTILNRNANDATRQRGTDAAEAKLSASRAVLLAAREGRVSPGRDDKALADGNAMMIAALAQAGGAQGRADWIASAAHIFAFVSANMTKSGRLGHCWAQGRLRHPAVLDDYAHMIRAALTLFEVTGDGLYLDQALAWLAVVNSRFWDDAGGGYYLTADDVSDVITRSKTIADNAVPSGNGVMLEVLARLYLITGDVALCERADRIVTVFSSSQARNLINLPGLMCGFEVLDRALAIIIVGDLGDPAAHALWRAAVLAAPPWRVILRMAPGATLAANHPAAGKTSVKQPTAFVCARGTCGLPITDVQALSDHLGTL